MFTLKKKDSNRQLTAVTKSHRESKTLTKTIITALKAPMPIQNAGPIESIIFDQGDAERQERYLKDVHALRITKPWLDYKKYTFQRWIDDVLFEAQPASLSGLTDEEFLARVNKANFVRKAFFHKRPFIDIKGHCIGAYSAELVPYPLPYDNLALTNARNSHELLKRIYYGWPTIHRTPFVHEQPKRVLDLGCGNGAWIIDAAQCWPQTQFYGIDVQKLWPSKEQLTKEYGHTFANNIIFIPFNFLLDRLPFHDNVFDMVRMANLKWCIPKNQWDEVLQNVKRVTAIAGLVEIIDDDFVMFTDPENKNLTVQDRRRCARLERRFIKFLRDRQLPLDTHEFMVETLKKHFRGVHQDVIPIGISPETRPIHTGEQKSGKRRSDGSSRSLPRILNRLNSASNPSVSLENADAERPLPPKPQPLGLVLPTLNRSLPCTNEEILAYATKNMQDVMCGMLHIRRDMERKNPEMMNSRREMTSVWKEELWSYQRSMSARLNINISQCGFDADSDDELEEHKGSSLGTHSRKEAIRGLSTFSQITNGESPWGGGHKSIARELVKLYNVDKLVRVIRVYTMWKQRDLVGPRADTGL